MLRGAGYLMKSLCKNDEDFYYMTNIKETDIIYFYSYRDNSNNVWFFDIRSIFKLINMNGSNPYTREPIPENVKADVNTIINKLRGENIIVDIDYEIALTTIERIKQKTVDIISQLNIHGYDCNIEWFLGLNRRKLKYLYGRSMDL